MPTSLVRKLAGLGGGDAVWRAMFDQSPAGLLAYDRDLRILDCTPRLAEILGAPREGLLGVDLHGMRDEGFPLETLFAALRGEHGSYDGPYTTTLSGRRLMISVKSSPLRAPDGEVLGGLVLLEDLTATHLLDEARRESEARYRQLVLQTPAPIVVHVEGVIVFANAAALRAFGATSEAELVGTRIMDRAHPQTRDAVTARFRRVAESHETVPVMEQKMIRFDGQIIDVEVTSIPLTYDGKQGILSVALDVTERRRLEEQLRQSQKMEAVGQLAGGVAHDFNNLLTVITSCAFFLRRQLAADSPLLADLDEIRKAAERAAALTKQLLVFGRKQPRTLSAFDLSELIVGTTSMLERLIGEGVAVALTLDPTPARMLADRGQIEQVIVNLAVNARDAMDGVGTLAITTANVVLDRDAAAGRGLPAAGAYVRLTVSDTGIGMDEKTLARAFEPFFTTKETARGTGLGLSMVYGIVEQSGGVVSVASEVSKGSTFDLYFPRDDAAPAPAPATARNESAALGGVILLVEDEPPVRAVVRRLLEGLGCRVLEAADGASAIRLAREHPGAIDLVLTDMIMPGMHGREVVSELRATRPALRAVYMSGYADDARLRRGELEPGSAFLPKPIALHALIDAVRAALSGSDISPRSPPSNPV